MYRVFAAECSSRTFPLIIISILLAACCLTARPAIGQEIATLPAALYEYDRWEVEVHPIRGIILNIERKVRVNTPEGRRVGDLQLWETFYQSLEEFRATVRDTSGGEIFSLEKRDLSSRYPFSDYRLYSEDRLYEAVLDAPSYPYVIEYEYQLEINNTFFWPDWILPDRFPRQEATYEVAVPHLFEYRTRAMLGNLYVDSSRTLKRDVTTWSITGFTGDPAARRPYENQPVIYVAPVEFVIARERGQTDTWAHLGQWYDDLTRSRREISEEQAQKVANLVDPQADKRDIVRSLKEYVSRNWRYVAIEIGIGGWRPHEAESVFQSKYGDCKDLTFLWLAMLDVFDITGHPALVRARNPRPLVPDFPKDWFDHVIGCAIVDSDTIWADLTAPLYPAGELPYQVQDRYALIIGKQSGTLVKTPSAAPEENLSLRTMVGELTPAGDLHFTLRARLSGHKLVALTGGSRSVPPSRTVAQLLGVFAGRMTLDTAAMNAEDGSFTAQGTISEWAEFTNERVIFPLAFAGWAAPQPLVTRSMPPGELQRPYPCFEVDTMKIILPAGYQQEFAPENLYLDGEFGRLGSTVSTAGDTLTYTREFVYDLKRAERITPIDNELLIAALASLEAADAVFIRTAPTDTLPGNGQNTVPWKND